MSRPHASVRRRFTRLAPLLATLALGFSARAQDGPLRFNVRLSENLANTGISGRLLVFMTDAKEDLPTLEPGFGNLNASLMGVTMYTAAQEVPHWVPGRQIPMNPDALAFPQKFSDAPKGDWQVMALLDRDHSYAYSGPGAGDLVSPVVRLKDLDPAKSGTVSLVLSKSIPARPLPKREGIRAVSFQSPSLTRFWGRPVVLRAGVVLPPGYEKGAVRYPTVYHVPGFGGDHRQAWIGPGLFGGAGLRQAMGRGDIPRMIHVFLDPSTAFGHTAFADSVNNGPVGSALVREFIPFLERSYRMAGPKGRFLTGGSSGGWSTLWLQVTYPEDINGTWSIVPDPVDFRSFTGVNIAADPPENVYRAANGKTRNLVRWNGRDVTSLQDFVRFEQAVGEYGGQFQSFEAVFSPRGADGRPMPLFNRQTGVVDPLVARRWRQYDITRILRANAGTLGPKLDGKLHVWAAGEDNFHLEEAVRLMRSSLKGTAVHADIRIVPKRDHVNLLTPDLYRQALRGMDARFRATPGR